MSLTGKPWSCIIIEDHDINRLTLEHFVGLHEQLELTASIPTGVEALAFFQAGGCADILLLDVEMPHLNGLELIRLLPEPRPSVVLVTTHTTFALEAFELQVIDYLVKPVSYARFCLAMASVFKRRRAAEGATHEVEHDMFANGNDMFVKAQGTLVRINFDDVLYIEALSAYVVLVTAKQKFVVGGTLKSIEGRLPFQHFVRVHRSYIVNLRRVESMQDNQLRLDRYEVPVGKSYQEEFTRRLRTL